MHRGSAERFAAVRQHAQEVDGLIAALFQPLVPLLQFAVPTGFFDQLIDRIVQRFRVVPRSPPVCGVGCLIAAFMNQVASDM